MPTVGYIYYSDGSCHADYDDTKQPIGIIFDAANKLVIALDEKEMVAWNDGSENYVHIPDIEPYNTTTNDKRNGQVDTDNIVAFAKETGKTYLAAEYCANKMDGNKKWFLPSYNEMKPLIDNYSLVNNTLYLLPEYKKITSSNSSNDRYWTSSVSGASNAFCLYLYNTTLQSRLKSSLHKVRCVTSI